MAPKSADHAILSHLARESAVQRKSDRRKLIMYALIALLALRIVFAVTGALRGGGGGGGKGVRVANSTSVEGGSSFGVDWSRLVPRTWTMAGSLFSSSESENDDVDNVGGKAAENEGSESEWTELVPDNGLNAAAGAPKDGNGRFINSLSDLVARRIRVVNVDEEKLTWTVIRPSMTEKARAEPACLVPFLSAEPEDTREPVVIRGKTSFPHASWSDDVWSWGKDPRKLLSDSVLKVHGGKAVGMRAVQQADGPLFLMQDSRSPLKFSPNEEHFESVTLTMHELLNRWLHSNRTVSGVHGLGTSDATVDISESIDATRPASTSTGDNMSTYWSFDMTAHQRSAMTPNKCLWRDGQERISDKFTGVALFGTAGAIQSTQFHLNHSIVVHIAGHKKLLLCPPSAGVSLYAFPRSHEGYHQIQSERFVNGSVDTEKFPSVRMLAQISGGGPQCGIADLLPGDLVYIPPMWYHRAESVTPSITLAFFSQSGELEVTSEINDALDNSSLFVGPPSSWLPRLRAWTYKLVRKSLCGVNHNQVPEAQLGSCSEASCTTSPSCSDSVQQWLLEYWDSRWAKLTGVADAPLALDNNCGPSSLAEDEWNESDESIAAGLNLLSARNGARQSTLGDVIDIVSTQIASKEHVRFWIRNCLVAPTTKEPEQAFAVDEQSTL